MGELWKDESFTPEMAMKGMEKAVGQAKWPIWMRSKVKIMPLICIKFFIWPDTSFVMV